MTESKKWRSGAVRYLHARPIYTKDWPKLILAMQTDGLHAVIMSDGVTFYAGGYEVKRKSIMTRWSITESQFRRFIDYILINDPFN